MIGVVARGTCWAAIYNLVWGAAWVAFMRGEWAAAAATIGEDLPFTARVWLVWIVLTVPFGVALMAYAASSSRSAGFIRPAVVASLVFWVPLTLGMAVWVGREGLPARIAVMDSAVNFIAALAASLAVQTFVRFPVTWSAP